MINFKIAGTGVSIPKKVVTNNDYAEFLDTSDEWISERTGIKERHIAIDKTAWEMAAEAGRQALFNSGISASDIDMVVVSSATSEYRFPALACIVQNELGLENAFCFDVSAACSGFIYAIDIAAQYFSSGRVKNVLVIASEKLSSVTDFTDRSTCVLFGDAAGAVVLSHDTESGLLSSILKSDGKGAKSLICRNAEQKSPWSKDISDHYEPSEIGKLIMDGKEVYRFAVKAMCDTSSEAMELAGVTVDDIKAIIPHQANIRIIDSAISKLKLDANKVYKNIDKFGNTSSASIPLILHELFTNGTLNKGDLVLFSAFGAGLTCGAVILKI